MLSVEEPSLWAVPEARQPAEHPPCQVAVCPHHPKGGDPAIIRLTRGWCEYHEHGGVWLVVDVVVASNLHHVVLH